MDEVIPLSLRNRWAIPANALCSVAVFCQPQRHRSGTSTDKTRVLGDLLDDILQGFKTVHEASIEYGAKVPGKGRPRRFSTFADYLSERARHAEDPVVEQELRETLVRSASQHHYRSGPMRSAETVRINRLLDETGPERATRLRELLAELAETACAAT